MSYIKILVNPSDSISFDRIINFPIRGIGKVCLDKIHKFSGILGLKKEKGKFIFNKYKIIGIDTNIQLHQKIIKSDEFMSGNYNINYMSRFD